MSSLMREENKSEEEENDYQSEANDSIVMWEENEDVDCSDIHLEKTIFKLILW